MIIFEKVALQNFMSYGNDLTEVDLKRPEPTLISGINYDASSNGELDSNGAGKSSILIAVSVALYDKPIGLDDAKKTDMVNNINNKDMLISLNMKVGKKKYVIHRYRKNKAMGGDGVQILENGKDITPDSTLNANKFIAEHIMDMPYEIFSKIVVYSAGRDAFLKMKLADQRNILEELFSYVELSRKAETLKEKIKNNKISLQYAKDTNEDIKEEAERHKKQLELAQEEHDEWEIEQKNKIKDIEKTIKNFSNIDFETELKNLEELENIEKQRDSLKNDLSRLKNDKVRLEETNEKFSNFETEKQKSISDLKKKLDDLKISEKEIEENKKLLRALDKKEESYRNSNRSVEETIDQIELQDQKINKLDKEISELEDSNCPYCKQKFEESAEKLKEVQEKRSKIIEQRDEYVEVRDEVKEKVEKLEEEIGIIQETLVFKSTDEIETFIRKRDKLSNQLEQTEKSTNPYEDKSGEIDQITQSIKQVKKELGEVEDKLDNSTKEFIFNNSSELYTAKSELDQATSKLDYVKEETNPHAKLVQNLKDRKPKDTKDDEIDELIDTIKHQEFLLKLLTKKDSFIRKALMDKYLPFLNERLKYYLKKMGLPHKVKFKSDMSTEISQFDKEIGHAMLSAGQKARIDIALSLAFRDVLQSKHSFINLYILDECLDVGLSNVGIKKTLKLIKDVAKDNKLSMFVISHRDEVKPAFNECIEIELRNGFSNVKKPS
jgi:DNA repair exonuclease SbcCD ATPase subunit